MQNRILGIDPGYGRVGIAILEKENGKENLLYSECFETDKELSQAERLSLIAKKIDSLILEWQPNKLAIETLLFSKNVKTALKVSEARGVIISEASRKNIPVFEFNPNSIKLAVTGYGKADKKQIINMINIIFKLQKDKSRKHDDEYDAIAVAITCSATSLSTQLQKI